MKRLSALFATVGCVVTQICFASSRLPDYDVTQMSAPGSGRYVFCIGQTCPEPTIKHLAVAAPIAPPTVVSPPLDIKPLPAASVTPVQPAHVHVRHAHRVRHPRRMHHTPSLPRCVGLGPSPADHANVARR